MYSLIRNLLNLYFFLVNKESWGKYDEQKNALGEAILNGERELQAIVEVNSE